MSKLVSIIIVNYNGQKLLQNCLSSITSIAYDNYEIILVDNNSTDDSVNFVKNYFPQVIIKQLDQNYGFAKANNVKQILQKGNLSYF